MGLVVGGFDFTESFRKELAACPLEVRQAVKDVLKKIRKNSDSGVLRLHPLKGYPKPTIYKIDVTSNKSWQISFEMDGTTAVLRRICTHGEMDRRPR